MWRLILCAAVLFASGGSPIKADPGDVLQTFLDPTLSGTNGFSSSLAAVGDSVVVGAYADETGTPDKGGAVFIYNGADGSLQHTLYNPTQTPQGHFGNSVAAVGDNVLVGAPRDYSTGSSAGAAYLFDLAGNHLQTFRKPTPHGGDRFGYSVAAVGNNVLVGAPEDSNSYVSDAGAAYMFDGSSGELIQTFFNPALPDEDLFGHSLAALGDDVIVGAPWGTTGWVGSGTAYLFDGLTGDVIHTLKAPIQPAVDRFGYSVAAVGKDILVGAPQGYYDSVPGRGAAYLFDGDSGELLRTFRNPAPSVGDNFGHCVAAVGRNVLIGDPDATTAGFNWRGAAYLFDGMTGELLETFRSPSNQQYFSFSVTAMGSNILVGGPGVDRGSKGAVNLFEGVPDGTSSLHWDGRGDGTWGDMLTHSRWVDSGGNEVDTYPDDEFTDAFVNSNVITVTEDRSAKSLTVESGTVAISHGRTLDLYKRVDFETGAILKLGTAAHLHVGSMGGTLDSVVSDHGATIHGDVAVNGILSSASGPDTLFVEGNLTLSESSQYVCGIDTWGNDLIVADRAVLSAGSKLAFAVDGRAPFQAGIYAVMSSGEITGTFGDTSGLGNYMTNEGLAYANGAITVTINKDLNPGDADLSTGTDLSDFNIWNASKFTSNTDWATGDFDGNGQTDLSDFNIWNAHKFTVASGGAAPAPTEVPEPSTLALLGCALVGTVVRWRRKRGVPRAPD